MLRQLREIAPHPAHEVPPPTFCPRAPAGRPPYTYTDQEIAALMGAAQILRFPLRALTFRT